MTHGVIVRVGGPIQAYHATHAEIMKAVGDQQPDGFILHVARATEDGFEILEVWEAKEQCDAFNRDVVGPAMERAGAPTSGPEPEVIEFEPRAVMAVQLYTSDMQPS
jgi:hypothetical protein